MRSTLSGFLMLGVLAACSTVEAAPAKARNKSPLGAKKPAEDNGEREAVRAWLKENLGNPEWEEVRWWPAVPRYGKGKHPEIRAIRLKYRTSNGGFKFVEDQTFEIEDGEVTVIDDRIGAALYDAKTQEANRAFTDSLRKMSEGDFGRKK